MKKLTLETEIVGDRTKTDLRLWPKDADFTPKEAGALIRNSLYALVQRAEQVAEEMGLDEEDKEKFLAYCCVKYPRV